MAKPRTKRIAPSRQTAVKRPRGRTAAITKATAALALVPGLMDDRGIVVVDRVVDRLGMTKQQFGRMIGVSGETLQKTARAESPKTQSRVREVVEIISRVRDWAGGEAQAAAWYKSQPIPAFGGRTAEGIVKSGEAPALRDYLDHLAMGGFA